MAFIFVIFFLDIRYCQTSDRSVLPTTLQKNSVVDEKIDHVRVISYKLQYFSKYIMPLSRLTLASLLFWPTVLAFDHKLYDFLSFDRFSLHSSFLTTLFKNFVEKRSFLFPPYITFGIQNFRPIVFGLMLRFCNDRSNCRM